MACHGGGADGILFLGDSTAVEIGVPPLLPTHVFAFHVYQCTSCQQPSVSSANSDVRRDSKLLCHNIFVLCKSNFWYLLFTTFKCADAQFLKFYQCSGSELHWFKLSWIHLVSSLPSASVFNVLPSVNSGHLLKRSWISQCQSCSIELSKVREKKVCLHHLED